MIRRIHLIAGTIFTEAVRRREIYAIVLITMLLLGVGSTIHFFGLEGLRKFYFEISLKVMSAATALTVIVLGARQLPREFERRTIYTLLAKPVTRWEFLLGKYLGVVGAGVFCLALFMVVFLIGAAMNHALPQLATFLQYAFLQVLMIAVVAALAFLLSMVMGLDAAITVAALFYLLGQVLTNTLTVLYDFMSPAGQLVLKVLNYGVPQPAIFDLSGKVVHGWAPAAGWALLLATGYAAMFVVPYLAISLGLFRRKAL